MAWSFEQVDSGALLKERVDWQAGDESDSQKDSSSSEPQLYF